ncbi:MAG: MCE family protein [Acidobacteria bacterium]|nr:MCE family protein [Acidobacteriota bacterium]
MPQRKQLTWTELRVGLFVLVGIFVVAVAIFYVTGAGVLGPKYRLRTYLPEVEGLTVGAPVRLDGIEVGNVDAIRVTPRTPQQPPDPKRSIELVLRIDRRYQPDIRTDSTAGLITEGLLGNRYVSIQRGFVGTPLQDGQEVPGREEKAIKAIVERGAELVQNLNQMSIQVSEIVDGIKRGRGSLGKVLVDETAYNHLNRTLGKVEHMVDSVEAGNGTLGKVYDPSIHDNAKQFLEKGNLLITDVRAGKGTLGKLTTDEELYARWRAIGANLESATAKLNSNQTTAGKFFTDPQFYDNMTGLAGDMRLLMGDFRQNPKKFLRVKFSLF